MKNILSQLRSLATTHRFFREEYLCPSDIAALRFGKALKESLEYYEKEKDKAVDPSLIHNDWKDNISNLESYLTGSFNENFISNEVINGTMVFTDKKAHRIELENISGVIDGKTVDMIIGKNLNTSFIAGKSRSATVMNSVHHLHHLTQFERVTGRKIQSMKSIVEFGGGYGNMARVIQNIGKFETYYIIDLLLFSCIQFIFLCTTAGTEQVAFGNCPSKRGAKFILYPLSLVDSTKDLRGELFLSTWALSESTRAAHDLVTQSDWFGARNLLLAYNTRWKPWQEDELTASLKNNGWRVKEEAIPFLPGSFYLFATR